VADIRRNENKRESWLVTNNTSQNIAVGDLLLLPVLKPNQTIDVLKYYSREKISHSTNLASLLKSGKFSLNKKKIFTNEFPGQVSTEEIDEALTPAEENEILKESEANEIYLKLDGTNANQNITLNNYEIQDISGIHFNTNFIPDSQEEGAMHWNNDESTLELGLANGDVVLQVGQEVLYKVKNQTGNLITDGTAVMFAGTLGASGRLLIQPMLADGTYDSKYFMGVVTDNILDGEDGFVTHFGKVRGINTEGQNGETWHDGDILYVSPYYAGSLTNVEPNSPNNDITVAAVVKAHSNGTIMVRPTFVPKLVSLQDVDGTPLTTSGQILIWDNDNKYFDPSYNIFSSVKSISTKINDYTVTALDYTILVDCSNNDVTITLLSDPSSIIEGQIFNIKCINDNNICSISANGYTIDGSVDNLILIKDESITVQSDSNGNWWII
jgi:hypothetical protein